MNDRILKRGLPHAIILSVMITLTPSCLAVHCGIRCGASRSLVTISGIPLIAKDCYVPNLEYSMYKAI